MHEGHGADTVVRCAICGTIRTRTLYVKWDYHIGRCIGCGLVYVNPRAPQATILARYSRDYFWTEYLPALGVVDGNYDLAKFDSRYAPLLGLLGPAADRRLLEVGCGGGFFLKSAERRGWRVTGIEWSEEATRFATERLRLDVRRGTAESVALAPSTFDAAVLFDTIEHLFDPHTDLAAVARALVPGGVLLVSTPNFRALSRWVLGPSWAVLSPLEHMYYFDEQTLNRLLENAGFNLRRFVRQNPSWNPQETMNFANTHAPRGLRARGAALASRVGGQPLARRIQRAGRQDILLYVGTRGG